MSLEQGKSDEQQLQKNHEDTIKKLEKDSKDFQEKYDKVLLAAETKRKEEKAALQAELNKSSKMSEEELAPAVEQLLVNT